ncbi:MAG TPA: cupin domain-containing protein [Bryobacteraceae bacterium]|jgi:mannose-6-phosphate isomerase-like protein (cupin superfamily)|nr:cupin domain-containing protein [Bryobacteraceae bacterium]
MTEIVPESNNKLDNSNNAGLWYEGTRGERITVRLSSLDTNGAYAIVESIAAPGCAAPMHLHRNEAEHFVILAGSYGIAIGEKIFEVSAGDSITLPKSVPHSWRNISSGPGRMVVILTPGGFKQCIQTIRNSAFEKLEAVAASYGCYIVGLLVSP